MKKFLVTALVIAIALFILYITIGSNLAYITDWSSAELVGYNGFTIAVIVGIGYFVYRVLKPKKQDTQDKS